MANFSTYNILLIVNSFILFLIAIIITWKTRPKYGVKRNIIENFFMWLFWILFLCCLIYDILHVNEII